MKKSNKTWLYLVIGLVIVIGFSALVSNITGPEEEEEVKFNDVSYSEYKELFNSEDLEFVYVGREGCSYFKSTVPLLGQLQEEEKIEFNYLNTDTMTQENFTDIATTAKAFEGEWGTPTLLAILDGKAIDYVSGYKEIADLREFVQNAKETASK